MLPHPLIKSRKNVNVSQRLSVACWHGTGCITNRPRATRANRAQQLMASQAHVRNGDRKLTFFKPILRGLLRLVNRLVGQSMSDSRSRHGSQRQEKPDLGNGGAAGFA